MQALEFISWFVRDSARGKKKIQLMPFAFPPVTPDGKQLGKTLTFHIDLFIEDITDSLEPVFNELKEITKMLIMAIKLYDINVKA